MHTLTDGPPPDLANLVITGANRRRNRTRMLTVVATIATLAVVSLPIVALQHRAPPGTGTGRPGASASLPPPSLGTPATPTGFAHPPMPGGGPRVLDAFTVSPSPGTGLAKLLNRATGQYIELPFSGITLSPDGNTLAVLSRGTDYNSAVQVGVVSRADALAGHLNRVRWLTLGGTPQWSPDGGKLLVETTSKSRVIPSPMPTDLRLRRDFAVFQVGSWERTNIPVTLPGVQSFVDFGWTADGNQLVYPVLAPETSPGVTSYEAMQYVHLDGTPGKRVGAHNVSLGTGTDAYSPSGLRVIAFIGNRVGVVDPADWHTLFGKDSIDYRLVGWYDDNHVIALKVDGTGENPVLQVLDMTGHITKQVPMPGNSNMSMQFRSSAGLAGAAANLGF